MSHETVPAVSYTHLGSSNCQKLRLIRPGQEDICSEYSESPWFYEVAEIAMILALKDYDACYAALKKTRQVVSGIAAWYRPEDLLGKKVMVVANLAPAKLRGVVSNGMILAADTDGAARVIFVDDSVPCGAKVR